jgi:4-amino-4-deoxy-L-arabinose transferase-like glycosyltransferase
MSEPVETATGAEAQSEANAADTRDEAADRQDGPIAVGDFFATLTAPRAATVIIVAIGLLIFIVNLGGYPLYTKGEPREAVTIFDIVNGGGIILPMRAGVEIPSKPLLMHWVAAAISLLAGRVNEWTVRLPSALFAIGGMVACYWYTGALFSRRAAFFSALILGTSFQYVQAGTGCRVDMTLTFFLEIAFFEFIAIAEELSDRITLLYLAIAAAVLTKGPVGVALPAIVAAVWMALYGRWDRLPKLRLGRGALIVGIIGGGWYLAAIASGGMDFVRKQLLAENLFRLFHHGGFHEGHAHPFYYEEGALIAGFMPWSLIAIPAVIQYVRGARKMEARFGYLLTWFLTVLIFYNLPQSKRGVYLLALYPALSAIIAILISDAIDHRETIAGWIRWLSRSIGAAFTILGAGGFVGLILLFRWTPVLNAIFARFDFHAPGLIPALAMIVGQRLMVSIALCAVMGAIGVYLIVSRPLAEKMMAGITGGAIALALAVNVIVEPGTAAALEVKDFAQRTMAIANGGEVGYFGSLDYGFAFYSGRNIRFVSPRDPNAPALIVSPQDDWNLASPATRAQFAIIQRSNPTNLDGSSPLLLLRRIDSTSAGKSYSL